MPVAIQGEDLFQASEVATQAGVSKKTLLRWIKDKKVPDAAKRDRNDWRLFSRTELDEIARYARRIRSA